MHFDVRWFYESLPGALVSFAGGVALLIGAMAKVTKAWHEFKSSRAMAAVPESPQLTAPAHDAPAFALSERSDTAIRNIVVKAQWTIEELERELEKSRKRAATAESESGQLSTELVLVRNTMQRYEANIIELRKARNDLESERDGLRDEVASLRRAVDSLRAQVFGRKHEEASVMSTSPADPLATPLRPPSR
jgi:septal ring factor EnvC (AmiA/AmiB activator)